MLKQHRSLPHLLRRLYHLVMGVSCFSLYAWVLNREQALLLLLVGGGFLIGLDILRLKVPWFKKQVLKHFSNVMRRNELLAITGNSFYIIGIFAVVLFFTKPVALLSILYLALGDPIAAFVGTQYGKTKLWGRKSLEGAFANFVVSLIATAWFLLGYMGFSGRDALVGAVIGGLVSTLAELCPVPVDDNLSVPILSALGLSLASLLVV